MASNQDLEILIGANSQGLRSGMSEAQSSVNTYTTQMADSMRSLERKTNDSVKLMMAEFNDLGETAKEISTRTSNNMMNMGQSTNHSAGIMSQGFGMIKSQMLQFAAVAATAFSVKHIVDVASSFELLEIRLKAVMGSAKDGKEAFDWIKQFALNTPNTVREVTDAFMQLKNFGLDPMDGTLQKVSDGAAKYGKTAETTARVTLALGQAWARGKLQGQDTLQMIDAGIPVYDLLAKATGKTTKELQDMSEKGTIGRDVIRQLIDEMGKEGAGAAADKMKSYAGAVSNMSDAFENAIDKLRQQGGFDFLTEGIRGFTALIPPLVGMFGDLASLIGEVLRTLWSVVSDVFSGIAEIINAVFGNGGEAITAMEFFKNTIAVIRTVIIIFKEDIKAVVITIKMVLVELISYLMMVGNISNRIFHLDISGAKAAWVKGTSEMKGIAKQYGEDIQNIANETRQQVDAVIFGGGPAPVVKDHSIKPLKDGDTSTPKTKKSKESLMGKFESELAEMKVAFQEKERLEGSFVEFSIEQELAFWETKLSQVKKGSNEEKAIRIKIANEKLAIDKKAFEAEVTKLKDSMDAIKNNTQAKLEIADTYSEKMKKAYGKESQQYLEAQKRITEIKRQAVEQLLAIDEEATKIEENNALESVEKERDISAQKTVLGMQTKEQELIQERQFEDKLYQIKLKAITAKIALLKKDPDLNPVELAKLLSQTEHLRAQHEAKVRKLDIQVQNEHNKRALSAVQSMKGNLQSTFQALLSGTASLTDGMKSLFQGVVSSIAGYFAEMAATWIEKRLLMLIFGESANKAEIGAAASLAGANGVASFAAAPWPIDMGAPAFGAAMSATAMAYGSIPSAESGFDIPQGVNPITQLHEQEMVLPKAQANAVRDMASKGSGTNGMTVNIKALDAAGIKKFLNKHGNLLVDSLNNQARNFNRR